VLGQERRQTGCFYLVQADEGTDPRRAGSSSAERSPKEATPLLDGGSIRAMTTSLLDYEVLTFDCYGTLIDWETGIWTALQPLLEANGADVERSEALTAFGELESEQEVLTPDIVYPQILTRVHNGLATRLGLTTTSDLDRAFGASVPDWPAFPDSAGALSYLAERYRMVILSNIDREGFAASNQKLGVVFDAVYTAEDVHSYKPDPANFDYLLSRLDSDFGILPESVLHVAQSLFHDHAPAKAAGLDTAWIDRQRLGENGDWGATRRVDERPEPDHVFVSMAALAEAVESA
jgi:2-haloalkanoic acid dehalogenase type II